MDERAPPDDPLALAEAAARGDERALARLLELYLPELRAFVRLRAGAVVRARESTSDIVQSVCREVLQHQERFRHPSESAFRQWLFTTALRKLVDRREFYQAEKRDVGREQARAGSAAGESGGEAGLLATYRSIATPSRVAAAREEIERLERAFDTLDEDHREVIVLAKLVGLSRAEIATRMQRSEPAVRMLLVRALAELSDRLAGPARTPPEA